MLGSNPRLIFPILFTWSLMLLERSFGFSYSHRNLFILGAICKSPISHVFRDHQTMPKSLKYTECPVTFGTLSKHYFSAPNKDIKIPKDIVCRGSFAILSNVLQVK